MNNLWRETLSSENMPDCVSLNQLLVSFNYRKRDYIVHNRNTTNQLIDAMAWAYTKVVGILSN